MQVVYIDSDALKARISSTNWTKPLIIEHGFAKAKIAGVEHCAHLAFEEEHNGAWTVEGIHEDDLHALFSLLIKIDPVFLVHLKIDSKVSQSWESVHNQLL